MRRVKQDRDVTSSYERGSSNNHTDDASITRSRRGKQDDAGRSNLAQRRTAKTVGQENGKENKKNHKKKIAGEGKRKVLLEGRKKKERKKQLRKMRKSREE